jgi:hypothetical protein
MTALANASQNSTTLLRRAVHKRSLPYWLPEACARPPTELGDCWGKQARDRRQSWPTGSGQDQHADFLATRLLFLDRDDPGGQLHPGGTRGCSRFLRNLVLVTGDGEVIGLRAALVPADLVDDLIGLVRILGAIPAGPDSVGDVTASRAETMLGQGLHGQLKVARLGSVRGSRRGGGNLHLGRGSGRLASTAAAFGVPLEVPLPLPTAAPMPNAITPTTTTMAGTWRPVKVRGALGVADGGGPGGGPSRRAGSAGRADRAAVAVQT